MKTLRTLSSSLLSAFLLSAAASAVPVEIQYQDPAGSGFFDTTPVTAVGGNNGATLGAQRRIALEFALQRWGKNIQGSIVIRVKAISLSTPRSAQTLASARPLAFRADWTQGTPPPLAGVGYPSALSTELAGVDLPDDTGSTYDIQVNNIPAWDTTTPGDTDQRKWYYGLDSQTPTYPNGNKDFDFVGVMLHEICHGLGFTSYLNTDGTYFSNTPTIWDTFMADSAGTAVTAMSPAGRMTMITSNNLLSGGPILRSHFNNNRAKLFAPNPFKGGSSLSHFDEATFSVTGSLNEMMTPVNSFATQVFGPLVLDMLKDMGYQMADTLPPVAGIDVPVSGRSFKSSPTPLFSGTATDTAAAGNSNAAGLLAVKVALYGNSQGKWYNWGTGAFDSGTFTYASHTTPTTLANLPIAVGSRAWSMTMPAGLAEGGYQLAVTSIDQINQGSEFIYNNFTIDNTASPIQITPFADNAQVFDLNPVRFVSNGAQSLTVQISKVTSGVTTVWNGSAWVAGTAPALATSEESAGVFKPSFSMPGRADWPVGSTLTIIGTSVDAASNTATATIHLTRTAQDSSVPDVTLLTLASGTVFTEAYLPALSGTASDLQSGIKSVTLSLARFVPGGGVVFWNGSDWSASPTDLPTSYDAGSGVWSAPYHWALPSNSSLPNANYSIQITATNGESPGGVRGVGVSFSVDHHDVYTWTGATFRDSDPYNDSHFWGTAGNWYPYGVPDVGDIAVIDNGDTVDSTVSRTVYGLRLVAGGLNFTNGPGSFGTLTATGSSKWGNAYFNGIWINPSGATLDLLNGGFYVMAPASKLENSGTINRLASGGYFRDNGPGGVVIDNLAGGVFNLAGDGSPFGNYYAGNIFNNAGTFNRSSGSTTVSVNSWAFNNTGVIRSDAPALQFDTVLTLAAGSTFAGTGQIAMNSQTTVTAALTIPPNVRLTGGTLNCPGGVTISGNFQWIDGIVSGGLNIPSGAVLNLVGGAVKILAPTSVINNSGTIIWNGQGGYLRDNGPGGVTINNLAGGIFNLAADGPPFENYYGGNIFNNAGTFKRTGGIAPTSIHAWVFNNSSTILSEASVLQFDGTLNLNSGSTLAGAAEIHLNGATTVNAALNLPSTVSLTGGVLNCPGGVSVGGNFHWVDGLLNGQLDIPAGATLDLTSAAVKVMTPLSILNNAGTVLWGGQGGYLRDNGPGGVTINNLAGGIFNLAADGPPFENYYGGNVFNNAGTFKRTGGTEATSIHSWVFNNTNIIRCDTAVLQFDSTLNLQSGTTFAGAGSINLNGTTNFTTATLAIPSTVTFTLTGGSLNCLGGTTMTGTFGWTDGLLNGQWNIAAGATFSLTGLATKRLTPGTVVTNAGTIKWSGGYLQDTGSGGVTITNLAGGNFNLTGDGSPFENFYGGNVINNAGTFARTGGSDPISIHAWTFTDTGLIRCDTSVLQFDTTLNLNSGATFGGSGVINLNGTTNSNAVTLAIPTTVTFIGGSLNCPGGTTMSGTLVWTDGLMNGLWNVAAGATFSLTGPAAKRMTPGSVITNAGTMNWSGGYLQDAGTGGCVVNNLAGATFNLASDGSPYENYYGGNTFTNSGTVVKSSGAGSANLHAWRFSTSGTVTATTGDIVFDGGSTDLLGGTKLMGGKNIRFSAGSTSLKGTTTRSGGGRAIFDGATLNGDADGTGALAGGRWDWSAGTFNGRIATTATASLFLSGTGNPRLGSSAVFENAGSFTVENSGSLTAEGSSSFRNLAGGTFLAISSVPFTKYYSGNSFINNGTVSIGGSPGVWNVDWDFSQSSTGVLNVGIAGPTTEQFDRIAIGGTASLAGSVVVTKLNGYTPANGTTFAFLTAPAVSGTFATVNGGFAADYTANSASLRALAGLTYESWIAAAGFTGNNALRGADPDGDGMTNFAEFAFNTNPAIGNPPPLTSGMTIVGGQKWLTLSYRRWADREAVGFVYTPLTASDLTSWNVAGIVDEDDVAAVPITGATARRCRVLATGSKAFLRVMAVSP